MVTPNQSTIPSGNPPSASLRTTFADAARFWEPRRVFYNLVLTAVVVHLDRSELAPLPPRVYATRSGRPRVASERLLLRRVPRRRSPAAVAPRYPLETSTRRAMVDRNALRPPPGQLLDRRRDLSGLPLTKKCPS